MARERIATRMASAAYDSNAVFSLLALCHTPRKTKGTNNASEANGAHETNGSNGDATNRMTGNGHPATNNDDEDDGGASRAAARKGDYTPAVHTWLKKLANKGLLRQLATGEPDEPILEIDEME